MKTFDQVPLKIGGRILPAGDESNGRTVILTVVADGDTQPIIRTGSLDEFPALWDAALAEYAAQYNERAESQQLATRPSTQDETGDVEPDDAGTGQLTLLSLGL